MIAEHVWDFHFEGITISSKSISGDCEPKSKSVGVQGLFIPFATEDMLCGNQNDASVHSYKINPDHCARVCERFSLLLLAGAASLYIGLQDQMDSQLKESRNIIIELYETEYQSLPAANSDEGDQLVNDLRGDLKEIHGHEYQYVALIVNKESEPLIIEEGRIENSVFRQGENFQLQKTGLYNRRLQIAFIVSSLQRCPGERL